MAEVHEKRKMPCTYLSEFNQKTCEVIAISTETNVNDFTIKIYLK